MSISFHRLKRFALILAGTAVLSGTVTPLAMADLPLGSDQTPATPDQCQMYQDWYNSALQAAAAAGVQVVFGNGAAYASMQDYLGQAGYDKNLAEARGCDTSTWASPGSVGSPVAVNRTSVGSVSAPPQ